MNRSSRVTAFAVVRIDSNFDDPARDANLLKTEPGLLINIVSVSLSENLAVAEAARLNELNSKNGMTYFWQQTRLNSESDGS
jgi:hypothetical protein